MIAKVHNQRAAEKGRGKRKLLAPNLVAVHGSCGRTCSEERAATHLTLYGAAGAVCVSCGLRAVPVTQKNGSELVNGQALVVVAWTPGGRGDSSKISGLLKNLKATESSPPLPPAVHTSLRTRRAKCAWEADSGVDAQLFRPAAACVERLKAARRTA